MLAPIGFKGFGVFRADNDDPSLPLNEFQIILAQLCQMRTAEGSGETAVEYQQNIGLAFKTRQAYGLTQKIIQGEIGGEGIENDF